MIDIPTYLNRIKYNGPLDINWNTLNALQKAHLYAVPFENLDIHYKRTIGLDIDTMYHKIVISKRGGFCYELNGLFYALLKEIGFNTSIISARVFNGELYSPPFDHMALIVEIGAIEYLVDVGFGDFIMSPLIINCNEAQEDKTGSFIVGQFGDSIRVSKRIKEVWQPEYIFTKQEYLIVDFKDRCNFHQNDIRSHFHKKKMISIPTLNGRITLTENELKIQEHQRLTIKTISNEESFRKELSEHFQINRIVC